MTVGLTGVNMRWKPDLKYVDVVDVRSTMMDTG